MPVRFEDEFSNVELAELLKKWHHENIKIASFEMLRKLIVFSGLSFKKILR